MPDRTPKSVANPDMVYTRMDDETIVLDTRTLNYFSLNETGRLIWDGILAGTSSDDLVTAFTDMYDVSREDAATHIQAFLVELAEERIIFRRPR